MEESELLPQKHPCPECGSSDALFYNTNGGSYCFSCNDRKPDDPDKRNKDVTETTEVKTYTPTKGTKTQHLKHRKITEATCKRYYYRVAPDGTEVAYYVSGKDKKCFGEKVRKPDKSFSNSGRITKRFFGEHLLNDNQIRVFICEGEIDAMTLSQISDHKYPVVSVPLGASSLAKTLKHNSEYLENLKEVIIVMDNDDAGNEAWENCKDILVAPKVGRLDIPAKDVNEAFLQGKLDKNSIWQVNWHKDPDMMDALDQELIEELESYDPTPDYTTGFPCIDNTYLPKYGEIHTFSAASGMGKSTITRQITYNLLKQGHDIAFLACEESAAHTYRSILGVHTGTNYSYDTDFDRDKMKNEYKKFYSKYRGLSVSQNLTGKDRVETTLNKIKSYALKYDKKIIVLDHLSHLANGSDNERQVLEEAMSKLRDLVQKLDIALFLVVHIRRTDQANEGGRVRVQDLKGSSAIEQYSNSITVLERNNQEDSDDSITTVRSLKNRRTGVTGEIGKLTFNRDKGILIEEGAELLMDKEEEEEPKEEDKETDTEEYDELMKMMMEESDD